MKTLSAFLKLKTLSTFPKLFTWKIRSGVR